MLVEFRRALGVSVPLFELNAKPIKHNPYVSFKDTLSFVYSMTAPSPVAEADTLVKGYMSLTAVPIQELTP